MSFIERFNIQCPFLGGSFIRGSTVLQLITLLPEFSEARLPLTSCYEEEESDDESVAKVEEVG